MNKDFDLLELLHIPLPQESQPATGEFLLPQEDSWLNYTAISPSSNSFDPPSFEPPTFNQKLIKITQENGATSSN